MNVRAWIASSSWLAFLRGPFMPTKQLDPSDQVLQVLMATDLAAFTELLVQLGDDEAQRLMRYHNRVLRECLRLFRGHEIAHTGDGMLVTFRSVRCGLACAASIQDAMAEHTATAPQAPLRPRIGLHIGEPLPEDDRLFGECVNMTVRICAAAPAGRILASDIVKHAAHGYRGVEFMDRGLFMLKGLRTSSRLFEVRAVSASDRACRVRTREQATSGAD